MSISTDPVPGVSPHAIPTNPENAVLARSSVLSTVRGKVAAGFLVVAMLGTGGFALSHLGGSSTGAGSTVAAGGLAGGGPAGGPGGGPGGASGGGGSFTPPTRGTISAVSASSISVKTTSGTQTYKITSATEIQDNGATVKTSGLTAGQNVVVFTGAPPNSTSSVPADTANRIMAGSSATAGPGGSGGGGTLPSSGSGTGTGTTT